MTLLFKLALLMYVAAELCHSYHYNSKTDYTRWRYQYPTSTSYNTWRRNSYQVTEKPHRIRHGGTASRFNRLDQVMYRLDNYFTSTTTTKRPRIDDSKTSSVESLLSATSDGDDYRDEDLDDDVFQDDDEDLDDEDDADYNDEDIVDDDKNEEVQAEEATNHRESPLTSFKWDTLGNRAAVESSRQRHLQTSPEVNEYHLALQHFKRVNRAMGCSTPVPKVLSVQKEHPNPGRTYIPHCTILHRCSEDTGCCHDSSKQCGPTHQTIVQLYFYVNYQGQSRVEKLSFSNHTKCACLYKSAMNASHIDTSDSTNAIVPSSNLRSGDPPENLRRCKCPMEYTPGYRYNQCICKCPEDSIDCDRMKKGKEYFSLKDRLCIKNGQCSTPSCEYGNYLKDVGRCPKKQEK